MPGYQPAQVIIIAQATLYRAGWSALLAAQPNINVAGAVETVAAVTAYLETGSSATLLIDFPSPLLPLIQQLHTSYPTTGLLALVDNYDLDQLLPLLRAGATGCISRDESVADLALAIIAVGRDEIWLPPAVAGRALAALARGESSGGDTLIEPLTERETDVLGLLARGLTNKDIAQTLILSVRTVEAHLRNIFGKLNVSSRTEAALWATRHGYGAKD
ncbi:MAG: response regulator transcription factor [Anaerolineae bacterium]|nr:response regulator transcription factor [Anaerolineae bacterium]